MHRNESGVGKAFTDAELAIWDGLPRAGQARRPSEPGARALRCIEKVNSLIASPQVLPPLQEQSRLHLCPGSAKLRPHATPTPLLKAAEPQRLMPEIANKIPAVSPPGYDGERVVDSYCSECKGGMS